MKVSAIRSLRRKLAGDTPVVGLWVTLESPSITEMAVALGVDWVVVDAEHGHLDWKEIIEHIRAAVRSETVVLVRVAEVNIGLIKRALDIGADGVMIPWMESAEQLRQAVAFAHYPQEGSADRADGLRAGSVSGRAYARSERARPCGADHRVGDGRPEYPRNVGSGGRGDLFLWSLGLFIVGRLSRTVGRAGRAPELRRSKT